MAEVSGVTPAIAQEPDGTRARILAEAVDMFTRHGYHRTSLRALADRLGITKAAILYHFPAKERIIAALMEPFVDALEEAIERAAAVPQPESRIVMLEGLLDAYFDFQPLLRMARTDATVFTHEPIYQRIVRLPRRTVEVMIGPDADLGERVWAMQLVSTLGDSVMLIDDAPPAELRAAILAGTARMLEGGPPYGGGRGSTWANFETGAGGGPNGNGRRVGRPRALSATRIARAREMHRAGSHTVDEIAATLGVSRATVYRYLADEPSHN
jgi:AcrR family transcriptional regulator